MSKYYINIKVQALRHMSYLIFLRDFYVFRLVGLSLNFKNILKH